jgi:hypothetical protein
MMETPMTYENAESFFASSRRLAKAASLSVFTLIAVGGNLAVAQHSKAKVDRRAMQANVETSVHGNPSCVPINGAQIIGGFGRGGDFLDVNTGEVCGGR